jgi:alkylation response protein AidB-like acyl-CoA dehydrogenase
MDFDLSDEQRLIRDAVRELCRSEFAAHAERWDRETIVPHEAVTKLAEHGFLGMSIPEEWGATTRARWRW